MIKAMKHLRHVQPFSQVPDDEHIIDVSASFPCGDDAYRSTYRKWREDPGNAYGFRFRRNTREFSYIDGLGFVEETPQNSERRAIGKNMSMVGGAICVGVLLQVLGNFSLLVVGRLLGQPVWWDLLSGIAGLSPATLLLGQIGVTLLSLLGMGCVLQSRWKLPRIVAAPNSSHRRERAAVARLGMACVPGVFVLLSCLLGLLQTVLSEIHITVTGFFFVFYDDPLLNALMFLSDCILLPVVMELVYHGILMQGLRQFGDRFALIVSAAACAVMIPDIGVFSQRIVLMLFVGCFTLWSGSIRTGIAMSVFYRILQYGYGFVAHVFDGALSAVLLPLSLAACVTLFGFLLWRSLHKKENVGVLTFYHSFLPLREKISRTLTTTSVVVAVVLSLAATIFSIEMVV